MNLPTPATTEELCYLQSWIPRNGLDIKNFYAARPGLTRPNFENSSKQNQLDTVISQMLAEHGAIIGKGTVTKPSASRQLSDILVVWLLGLRVIVLPHSNHITVSPRASFSILSCFFSSQQQTYQKKPDFCISNFSIHRLNSALNTLT